MEYVFLCMSVFMCVSVYRVHIPMCMHTEVRERYLESFSVLRKGLSLNLKLIISSILTDKKGFGIYLYHQHRGHAWPYINDTYFSSGHLTFTARVLIHGDISQVPALSVSLPKNISTNWYLLSRTFKVRRYHNYIFNMISNIEYDIKYLILKISEAESNQNITADLRK